MNQVRQVKATKTVQENEPSGASKIGQLDESQQP